MPHRGEGYIPARADQPYRRCLSPKATARVSPSIAVSQRTNCHSQGRAVHTAYCMRLRSCCSCCYMVSNRSLHLTIIPLTDQTASVMLPLPHPVRPVANITSGDRAEVQTIHHRSSACPLDSDLLYAFMLVSKLPHDTSCSAGSSSTDRSVRGADTVRLPYHLGFLYLSSRVVEAHLLAQTSLPLRSLDVLIIVRRFIPIQVSHPSLAL